MTIEQLIEILVTEEKEVAEALAKINAERIKLLLEVLASIRLCLQKHVDKMRADKSVSSAVAAFLFCKVIRNCRAVSTLCVAGWGVEAELLARSGLEALINLLYITQKDCEERATLYSEFDHMLAESYPTRVDQWPHLFKGLGVDLEERRREIKENWERVKRNYPKKYFWASKLIKNGRLREMAKQVGLQWYYDFLYWFASNHSHANVRSAVDIMRVSRDGKFHFNLGPSDIAAQYTLLHATDFLLRAYQCLVGFFKLPEENNVNDLIAKFSTIYKDVRVT